MGNQESNLNPSSGGYSAGDVLEQMNGGTVSGGCGCVMGGYTEMQQYGESIYSKAKEKLIRDIADDTFGALGLSSKKPKKTDSIDKVVADLTKLAPGGKGKAKFTTDFYKNSKAQRDLCHAMAKAINRNYGSSIIPADATEAEMCSKVAEVMNTLLTGMHTEFLSVAGDVSRIIRNIETLKRFTDASYKRQEELAKSCGDPQIAIQVDNATEFYKRIQVELERQLAILTNLMNATIDPASQNLIKALEDNRDFYGTVRELREDLGTPAFGNKLAALLSGVSSVAHSADLIDKALRKIGMSVQEFKSTKSPAELRMKVLKHIQDKNPGSKELDKLLQAADLIFRNDYSHDAIVKLLGNTTRGGRRNNLNNDVDFNEEKNVEPIEDDESGFEHVDMMGGATDGDEYGMHSRVENGIGNGVENGNENVNENENENENENKNSLSENYGNNIGEENHSVDIMNDTERMSGTLGGNNGLYWDRKNLSKKIDRKDKYRELILKDFKKVIQGQYRNIVEAADHIAKHIGSTIPVNEDLDRFVQVFAQIDTLDKENLHVALSGYPRDAESKYQRDQFLDKYRLLIDVIKPLTSGPAGQQFKEVQKQCEGLIKTIDDFSDKMVKALTEIHIDRPDEIRAELKRASNLFFGNAEHDAIGGDSLSSLSFGDGSFVALKKVQNDLRYYMSIAHIKTNMARVSEEMKDYADDYDEMVGEEAAYLIDSIKRDFQALINDVEATATTSVVIAENKSMGINAVAAGAVGIASAEIERLTGAANAALSDEDKKKRREALVAFYTYQMNAKVKMVEVAQSIDIYMRYFADGIARDPDSIKSVVKMLDQVEIVAKWFTEKSGDNLANLFEFFPADIGAAGVVDGFAPNITAAGTSNIITGPHYYEAVTMQSARGNLGNPFIGRVLETKEQAEGLQKQTEKCIKSMRALENILSTFFSVGDKFAGEELKSKSILTPGYILNALFEYINASAFTSKYNPYGTSHVNAYLTGLDQDNDGKLEDGLNKVGVENLVVVAAANNPEHISREALASTSFIADFYNGIPNANRDHSGLNAPNAAINLKSGTAAGRKNISIAMSAIPQDVDQWWQYHNPEERTRARLNRAAWLDTFYDTDMLFVMVIKSIITKILAVVDAYRLFNKPVDASKNRALYNVVSPLRGILGGSDQGDESEVMGGARAKIMPEALELYVRLPLLAEWYREQLSLESQKTGTAADPNNTWRLVVVPSIDGIWSGFLSLLFDKADYVKQGNYTEAQLDQMIEEMNLIYKHYKSRYPKATVRNIIVGFISEINHAFGFMRRDQITTYLNNRRKYLNDTGNANRNYQTAGQTEDDFNDYDLLNSEDQYGRAPVPSDKYLTVALKQQQQKQRNMVYLQEVVNQLREKIDNDLRDGVRNLQGAGNNTFTFNETLTNYKKELDAARDENERHRMVIRLLQGSDRLNVGNVDKFIMVHEAVAAPLVQLFNIYKLLSDVNAFFHGASIENLDGYLQQEAGVAVSHANYLVFLRDKYVTNTQTKDLAGNFTQFALRGQTYLVDGAALGANLNQRIFDPTNTHYELLLRDVISMLSDLASNPNKLIQVNISSPDNVNIDWSSLESLAMELLAQVKSNVNSLRLDLSYGSSAVAGGQVRLLQDYENRNICGSIPWLEERLVESLLKDRDRSGLGTGLNQFIETVKVLTNNDTNFNGRGRFDYNNSFTVRGFLYNLNGNNLTTNAGQFPLRNNLRRFPFNVLSIKIESDLLSQAQKDVLQKLISGQSLTARDAQVGNTIIPVPWIDQSSSTDLDVRPRPPQLTPQTSAINSWELLNPDTKNLLCFFNKLVHMYLHTAFDETTMKIYTPLFENFMNSAAAKEINSVAGDNNVINNVLDFADGYNQAAKPPNVDVGAINNNAVLYKSVVETMKSLMQNMDMRLKKKKHVFDSLAEVPIYMKERMKCNLPLFSKMFNMVFERADLLRKLLNNGGFVNACDGGDDNARNGSKNKYDAHLSRFCDLALSIKKCCDSVHKELQDSAPYFMDLGKDFISDYKQRYSSSPFMPASDVVLPQRGYSGIDEQSFNSNPYNYLLLPTRENGSDVYRYNFASRLLLVRPDIEPTLDHMPGAKEIYNNYAEIAAKAKHIGAQEYAGTIKNLVRAARFLNDGVVYSRFLDRSYAQQFDRNTYSGNSPYNLIYNSAEVTARSYLGAYNASLQTNALNALPLPLFDANRFITKNCVQFHDPANNPLRKILQYSENSVKETSKREFAAIINNPQQNAGRSRRDLQVLNILDLDVVPINVHALMREVPFVNILNYSYTFDRMVQELITPGYMLNNNNAFIQSTDLVQSSKELMVKMLIHPYTPFVKGSNTLDENKRVQYLGIMASLFNGNDDFHLGRPRYLSDQLWNKVLLNSPVEFSDEQLLPLEIGPRGYLAANSLSRIDNRNIAYPGSAVTLRRNIVAAQVVQGIQGAQGAPLRARNQVVLPNVGLFDPMSNLPTSDGLRYWHAPQKNWVVANTTAGPIATGAPGQVLRPGQVRYCAQLGALRFDTKLVRNLTWLTQAQRLIRVALITHLSRLETPVVRGLKIADPKITEYNSNDAWSADDFNAVNNEFL